MQTLHIRLKFPDQSKKSEANGFLVKVDLCFDSISVEGIRKHICAHPKFQEEIHVRKLDEHAIDFRFLCGGCELASVKSLEAFLSGTKDHVVAKISKITDALRSIPSPPPSHRPSVSDGSDLSQFREFLLKQNSALIEQFFEGNTVRGSIQGTKLHQIAFREVVLPFSTNSGDVDSIIHCIGHLTALNERRDKCVAIRKILNKEELDIQKYCFEVGKVNPLNLHKQYPALFPAPPLSLFPDASPAEETRTAPRKTAWTYAERLHHKLHDMLMFDIAELELDGKRYKGEPQNPKRDLKAPDKVSAANPDAFKPFVDAFKRATGGGRQSTEIPLQKLKAIVAKEMQCEQALKEFEELVFQALSECGLSDVVNFDHANFLKLVKKLHEKRLLAFASSLNQMLVQCKGLSCTDVEQKLPAFEKCLNDALDITQAQLRAALSQPAPPPVPEHWFAKENKLYNLEDILFCWRKFEKSSNRKKVMPLPLSSLCKHMFDTALNSLKKGASVIGLKAAADIVMKEFARELRSEPLVASFWENDATRDVDEIEFLTLAQGVFNTKGDKKFPTPRFKQIFASVLQTGGSSIKLKHVREVMLQEFASELNGEELITLLKLAHQHPASEVNEAKFYDLVRKLQPLIGVQDVVDFYDKLVLIEEHRKSAQKPVKLEFVIDNQSQRFMDMHRILDSIQREMVVREKILDAAGNFCEHKLCFEGKIEVRCAPMKCDDNFRASYLKLIAEINELQRNNEEQLNLIRADIKVLSSFLFILARARMHDQKVCDAEVEATSSLGLTGMKQFRSFVSDAIFKAESEAYEALGITLDAMRADPQRMRQLLAEGQKETESQKDTVAPVKEDIHQIRARFRQLCFASIKELHNQEKKVDYAQFMRDPFRRLRKPQSSSLKPLDIPKPTNGDTFTVATVRQPEPLQSRAILMF